MTDQVGAGATAQASPETVQKTVVVLGAHRNGTSSVAGILEILGVDMGDTSWLPGDGFNPRGYFEDGAIAHLNERLLDRAGGSWTDPPEPGRLEDPGELGDDIRRLARRDAPLWGWKDPRTDFTVHLWLPHLVNPHCVVCLRNPVHAARSLVHLDVGFDLERALRLVSLHHRRILDFLETQPHLPRTVVAYEDLVANPVGEAERLARFLDLEPTEEQRRRIGEFVMRPTDIEAERRRVNERLERAAQQELPRVRAEVERLRSQLEQIEASRAWRLLVRLRLLKRRIPLLGRR